MWAVWHGNWVSEGGMRIWELITDPEAGAGGVSKIQAGSDSRRSEAKGKPTGPSPNAAKPGIKSQNTGLWELQPNRIPFPSFALLYWHFVSVNVLINPTPQLPIYNNEFPIIFKHSVLCWGSLQHYSLLLQSTEVYKWLSGKTVFIFWTSKYWWTCADKITNYCNSCPNGCNKFKCVTNSFRFYWLLSVVAASFSFTLWLEPYSIVSQRSFFLACLL